MLPPHMSGFRGPQRRVGDIEQCSAQAAAYAQPDYQRLWPYGGAGGSMADGAPATIETLVGAFHA